MKIKTLVIAPYAGLAELTGSLVADLPEFDITVRQGDLMEVLPWLDSINPDNYDLIISRGGTARLLRKHTALPVIDIPISGFDIMRMLTLIKGYHTKVEMIGFANVIEGFISVSSLMEIDISYSIIQHEDEVGECLMRAKERGVKVIVGDHITVKKAAELAMRGILITSGRESVLAAFAQAKQMYTLSKKHNEMSDAYETLLNSMDIGYAIMDHGGYLKYTNHRFRELIGIPGDQQHLFEAAPDFRRFLRELEKGITVDEKVMMVDPLGKYAVAGGAVQSEGNERAKWFYLKVRPSERVNCELTISYSNTLESTFSQLMMTEEHFYSKTGEEIRFPVAIYGEKGVGKRMFALKLLEDEPHKSDNMVELGLRTASEDSYTAISRLIMQADAVQLIYMHGVEKLPPKQQRDLARLISLSQAKIIFSFNEHPVELKEARKLDEKLCELLKNQIFHVPPLRHRVEDMQEYVRTFLTTFNERYGKQIVGLKPLVWEALQKHPWEENLFELRDIVEQFVVASEGEYVDTHVLPILQKARDRHFLHNAAADKASGPGELDLHKPLVELEKDIIQLVLEEENMNQTAAAKRLGINRSTLWRKLKA